MNYININKHKIRKGEPACRVSTSKSGKGEYFSSVKILGPCELLQSPTPILKCGAKVVIRTYAAVEGTP